MEVKKAKKIKENCTVKNEEKEKENKKNEESKKYDIVFIGGGPATIGFLCYLFQHNLSDKVFNFSNILIIEKNENFGSGCLGSYGINSNTSSEGFVRLICKGEFKEKYIKEGLSPSKNPMKNSENYKEKEKINQFKRNSFNNNINLNLNLNENNMSSSISNFNFNNNNNKEVSILYILYYNYLFVFIFI
jgi:hypothetical protein